jgi:uncharacterized protein YaeQ
MAIGVTMHRARVTLSDVDRGVYESVDFRLARHPSESTRFLVTRLLAYCLSYEPGIAFSKGGLSSTDEAPISIWDPTGRLMAWIDIGVPKAERLHRASKAASRVLLYTSADLGRLRKEAKTQRIHRQDEIEVWHLATEFLDALGERLERTCEFELVRSAGRLYATFGADTIEGEIERQALI